MTRLDVALLALAAALGTVLQWLEAGIVLPLRWGFEFVILVEALPRRAREWFWFWLPEER